MGETTKLSGWTRHFVYRSERTRTTWKLRIGLLCVIIVVLRLSHGWWTEAIARSLVCDTGVAPSDAILVETFDLSPQLFERARELRHGGLAPRVVVPVPIDPVTQTPDTVAVGIVDLMARLSRVGAVEIIPVRRLEPITINAARDMRRYLERERIRSLIVVTPLFRSRRSALVYDATLGPAGIAARYQPVQGPDGVSTWTRSWHGIQDVLEQWLKLNYYRVFVLPSHR